MLAKIRNPVVILIFCTLAMAGQFNALAFSTSSSQEDAPLVGIDVSRHQGKIDWHQVMQNEPEISFVFIKATEGGKEVDPRFKKNWQESKNAGLLRGAYHVFNANQDSKTQATLFINTVKKLEENDLPPWLNLESGKFDEVDEEAYQHFIDSVLIWLEEVEKGLGVKPIIYTRPDFARDYLTDVKFSSYPLAAAEYDDGSGAPHLSGAWAEETWTFWQYDPDGKVKGVKDNPDLIKFNGSNRDLTDFINNSHQGAIEVTLTEEKESPAMEEKKELPPVTIPEAPISEEAKEPTPITTEPEHPTVEPATFNEEIDLGKIRFPRDFIHKGTQYKKGMYQVKLVFKGEDEQPSFHLYDKENRLLLEEMALVIPRKVKHGKFKYRTSKRIVGNEYFMIKVTKPDKHIYAFFLIQK